MSDSIQPRDIPIPELRPHPHNPRLNKEKSEETIRQLSRGMKEGFDTAYAPIVRPCDGGYQIVSGHRRIEAAKRADLTEVPCWVREMSDEDAHALLLKANTQDGMHPIEEGTHQMSSGLTQHEYAKRMGIHREVVKHKVAAAKVYKTISEEHSLEKAGRYWRALAELRTAKPWLWPVWASRLVTEGWTVKMAGEKVARAGGADEPPAWADSEGIAAGLLSGAVRPEHVSEMAALVAAIKDRGLREEIIEALTQARPAHLDEVKGIIRHRMPADAEGDDAPVVLVELAEPSSPAGAPHAGDKPGEAPAQGGETTPETMPPAAEHPADAPLELALPPEPVRIRMSEEEFDRERACGNMRRNLEKDDPEAAPPDADEASPPPDAAGPDDPESYPEEFYPKELEQPLPQGTGLWIDCSVRFCYWFEREIVEGRMAPSEVDIIGSNLQHMAQKYWGRGGKRYPRKPDPKSPWRSARRKGGPV